MTVDLPTEAEIDIMPMDELLTRFFPNGFTGACKLLPKKRALPSSFGHTLQAAVRSNQVRF